MLLQSRHLHSSGCRVQKVDLVFGAKPRITRRVCTLWNRAGVPHTSTPRRVLVSPVVATLRYPACRDGDRGARGCGGAPGCPCVRVLYYCAMPWWTQVPAGNSCRVIALHVDLAGHSRWAAEHDTDLFPARERKEFATLLELNLEGTGFARLFWAGDGGLFVRRFDGKPEEFEEVASAGAVCFQQFTKWKKKQGGKLRLRVLAAYLGEVIVYEDAGHWFSPRLNALLKYERDLGFEDAFIVTDDLHRKLNRKGKFYQLLLIRDAFHCQITSRSQFGWTSGIRSN